MILQVQLPDKTSNIIQYDNEKRNNYLHLFPAKMEQINIMHHRPTWHKPFTADRNIGL